MNNGRRTTLEEAVALLEQAKEKIESVQSEEQECYDNLPENFQEGEKGERMQECIYDLDDAISSIDDAISYVDSAKE